MTKKERENIKKLREAVYLRFKNGQELSDQEFIAIWETIKKDANHTS